jgi:arylsulfatase A-like enzyme
MKRKLLFIYTLVLVAVLSLSLFWQCGSREPGSANPHLLDSDLTFAMPQNGQKRFSELIAKNDLAKHFKQGAVNTYYKKEIIPWLGRVRDNEVSYHALFAMDDSKITCSTNSPDASGLHFSIFHPAGSDLTYRVSITHNNNTRNVFEKSFKEKSFSDNFVLFEKPLKGDVKVVFETSGTGTGAWVNPRFHLEKEKPRVFVVIVMDTLRYDHTSLYGYKRKTTPFLEQLAADGIKYENAFSSTSWTLPAHVSLFSGKDLSEHGVVAPGDGISTVYPLIAEIFQEQGFVTAAFTGGGFVEDTYGFYRGFQYYSNAPGNVFSMNSAERVFNHFKNYITRFWGNDLFIFLHTYQIHTPYKAPRRYVEQINKDVQGNLLGISNYIKEKSGFFKALEDTERQRLIDLYDASVLYTDDALVGGVIRLLKEKGMYEQAVITVLSDHGEEFYDHGGWEHGHTLYNELIRIPLVIKFPFSQPGKRNRVESALASITDIPGLLLRESGLAYDSAKFPVRISEARRRLPVLFPESPIIKQFLTKVSFVDERFHFIFNQVDENKLRFFDPQPKEITAYELYERTDVKETHNLTATHFRFVNQYKEPLKLYLEKLKQLKRTGKKLDKDLEEKLKSLGYLGN